MNKQKTKNEYEKKIAESVSFLNSWIKKNERPDLCVVLGSGLGSCLPELQNMRSISFSEIPGFKSSDVPGHKNDLRIGKISEFSKIRNEKIERNILFLRGRNHAYEGNTPGEVVHNVRTMISLGVKKILLTNAAGCLEENWPISEFMMITDHINMTGLNPCLPMFGSLFQNITVPKFIDMSSCYTTHLQTKIEAIFKNCELPIRKGVYYGVLGPSYETPAEIKMMKIVGASAVGMSTVLEALAIRQLGGELAGLSFLTNYAAGLKHDSLNHADVVARGQDLSLEMRTLLRQVLVDL